MEARPSYCGDISPAQCFAQKGQRFDMTELGYWRCYKLHIEHIKTKLAGFPSPRRARVGGLSKERSPDDGSQDFVLRRYLTRAILRTRGPKVRYDGIMLLVLL